MPTSDEYRATAEECYRLAREAKNATDRLACLDLAQTWLEAASRQDQMTPDQIAQAEKLARQWSSRHDTPRPEALSGWLQRVLGLFR